MMMNQKKIKISLLEKCFTLFYTAMLGIGISISCFIVSALLVSRQKIELKFDMISPLLVLLIVGLFLLFTIAITYVFYQTIIKEKNRINEETESNQQMKNALQQKAAALEVDRVLIEVLKRKKVEQESEVTNFIDFVLQQYPSLINNVIQHAQPTDIIILKEKIQEEMNNEPLLFKKFSVDIKELVLKNKIPIDKKSKVLKAMAPKLITAILIVATMPLLLLTMPFLFNLSAEIFSWPIMLPAFSFTALLTAGFGTYLYKEMNHIWLKNNLQKNNEVLAEKNETLLKKLLDENQKYTIHLVKKNNELFQKDAAETLSVKPDVAASLNPSQSFFNHAKSNSDAENILSPRKKP